MNCDFSNCKHISDLERDLAVERRLTELLRRSLMLSNHNIERLRKMAETAEDIYAAEGMEGVGK